MARKERQAEVAAAAGRYVAAVRALEAHARDRAGQAADAKAYAVRAVALTRAAVDAYDDLAAMCPGITPQPLGQ